MKKFLILFSFIAILSACQSSTETSSEQNASVPTHNPAHGQPYHDCSLAVGAPLLVEQPALETTNEEGVKLNPPHGEPGHSCEIAVGEPLI